MMASNEITSCCDEKDCLALAGWGLGRGVNITKATPWADKTTFQVREVKPEHIIVTNDGELLKAYSEEVRSRTAVSSEVQAGIRAASTPLSVRIDLEYTRSALATKYIRGMKIKKRTISFLTEFVDVPQLLLKKAEEGKLEAEPKTPAAENGQSLQSESSVEHAEVRQERLHAEPTGTTFNNGTLVFEAEKATIQSEGHQMCKMPMSHCASFIEEVLAITEGTSFEERLISWVKLCLKSNGYDCDSPTEDQKQKMSEEIENLLDRFVQEFGVTHYVSSIELGALEYQEQTSSEFLHSAKFKSSASVTAATYGGAEASITQKITKATKQKRSEWKRIGVMENDVVTKEAVIGCSLTPISRLIKKPHLQQALKNSIDKYNVQETSKGIPHS